MYRLPRSIEFLIALFVCTTVAPPLRAQKSGWKATTSGRDANSGSGADGKSPSPFSTGATSPAAEPVAPPSRPTGDITPVGSAPSPIPPGVSHAQVTKGSSTLPQDHGQVWREYDIRPYTNRVTNTARPEQAIVDWILRETGYEAWHSEPVGLLSANHDVLRVYHTPEMQAVVADIADRFVNSAASAYAFTLRVSTVGNPNWRAKALTMMTPIPVQSPGVQGWLLAKENARLLVADLMRRTDYREYNSPQQLVSNGQSIVISTMRPRSYIRNAVLTQTAWPGYQPEMGTIEEGFSLEFSPLLSLDLASADAVIKLRLNQVEKMVPVKLDLPSTAAPNQRVQIEVPQMTSSNLHERFRWPTDKVLLLSMGVVATPGPTKDNPITDAVTDAVPILKSPPRADALLFIECAGVAAPAPSPITTRAASLPQQSFQGRY
ncbi:MAG TPA: hypothetical protein VFW73_13265 [Lacipirellulaceae bacterium]|nr:hypothetical protein [Lacipirellulaceae bacterium]